MPGELWHAQPIVLLATQFVPPPSLGCDILRLSLDKTFPGLNGSFPWAPTFPWRYTLRLVYLGLRHTGRVFAMKVQDIVGLRTRI